MPWQATWPDRDDGWLNEVSTDVVEAIHAGGFRRRGRLAPCRFLIMDRSERVARAEDRRERAVLNRTKLGLREPDPTPVFGVEALALVSRLTREGWSAAGLEMPRYSRSEIPVRFVPGGPT